MSQAFNQERDAARALSPDIAWPSLAFAVLLPVLHLTLVWEGLTGRLNMWALTPALGFTAYMHYTIVHEAVHRNFVRKYRGFDPVNNLLGWIGSTMIGCSWPLLQRTHLAHHAHTNTDKDADIFLKGSFGRLIFLWLTSIPANLIPVPILKWAFDKLNYDSGYLNTRDMMSAGEWRLHIAAHTAMCAIVWGAVALGYGAPMFALYVLPASIGRLLLGIFQQWLPHFPFEESSRYRMARIMRAPGGKLVAMGHDVHLVHHLWPSVPFYRYGRLYRQIAPLLAARGVRVEGLVPQRPAAPPQTAATAG